MVVGGLKGRQSCRWNGKFVNVNAVLQDDHNVRSREPHSVNRGTELDSDDDLALFIVPYCDLAFLEPYHLRD